MRLGFRGKPTKAELDRNAKGKADEDRGRMEDFKARLDTCAAFVGGRFGEEESSRIHHFLKVTSDSTKNIQAVSYDVTGVDQRIDDILKLTQRVIENGGSSVTVLRGIQGIAYGILNGHAPISSTSDESDVLHRRETTLDRYLQCVSYYYDIDRKRKDIEKLEEKKETTKNDFDEAFGKLQKMKDSDHKTFYQIKDMSPSSLDKVTGAAKIMAAQMARTIMLDKKLRQIDLSIGQNYKDIVTLEDNCNTLDLQISSWEPEIDAHSAEELSRITQEFKRELLQHKVVMKSLENAADEVDKAVNELYAGKDAVEGAIKISERYERLEREMAFAEQEEDKARRRYEMEQEQLKQKQEQEKEAQKLDQGTEENKMGRILSYN